MLRLWPVYGGKYGISSEDFLALCRALAATPSPTGQAPSDDEKETRLGRYVRSEAARLGWPIDGPEGAFEFMMRRCREVALEDAQAAPAYVAFLAAQSLPAVPAEVIERPVPDGNYDLPSTQYGDFWVMAQGEVDHVLQAFAVEHKTHGPMLVIGAPEAAVYLTKEQADAFFSTPSVQPATEAVSEEQRAKITAALEAELGDVYDCTRVWEAWSVGTMGEDDFSPVTDRLGGIVESVVAALQSKGTTQGSEKL